MDTRHASEKGRTTGGNTKRSGANEAMRLDVLWCGCTPVICSASSRLSPTYLLSPTASFRLPVLIHVEYMRETWAFEIGKISTLVEARALALASQWALIGTEATMLSPERGAPPTEPSQPQVAGMASCGELWRSEARGRREGAKRGRCARAAGAVLPALPGARLRREGGHECAHLARQGEVCCHA